MLQKKKNKSHQINSDPDFCKHCTFITAMSNREVAHTHTGSNYIGCGCCDHLLNLHGSNTTAGRHG